LQEGEGYSHHTLQEGEGYSHHTLQEGAIPIASLIWAVIHPTEYMYI
jgi:response regulator RpfG family c-di-GMP phosphodiesterase